MINKFLTEEITYLNSKHSFELNRNANYLNNTKTNGSQSQSNSHSPEHSNNGSQGGVNKPTMSMAENNIDNVPAAPFSSSVLTNSRQNVCISTETQIQNDVQRSKPTRGFTGALQLNKNIKALQKNKNVPLINDQSVTELFGNLPFIEISKPIPIQKKKMLLENSSSLPNSIIPTGVDGSPDIPRPRNHPLKASAASSNGSHRNNDTSVCNYDDERMPCILPIEKAQSDMTPGVRNAYIHQPSPQSKLHKATEPMVKWLAFNYNP